MMLYLRIYVKRVFGKVPSGKTGRFFASLAADAISTGRFEETHTIYEAVNRVTLAFEADRDLRILGGEISPHTKGSRMGAVAS